MSDRTVRLALARERTPEQAHGACACSRALVLSLAAAALLLASAAGAGADGGTASDGTAAAVPVGSSEGAGAGQGSGPGETSADGDGDPDDGGGLLDTIWEALQKGADFFFKRGEGEAQHERSWGIVPLVIADSTRGFGGGVAVVEQDLLGLDIRAEVNATASSQGFFEPAFLLDGPTVGLDPGIDFDWRIRAEYRERPRLVYYGIGNRTTRRGRAALALEETRAEVRVGAAFTEQVSLFGLFRFQNVNARDGELGSIPPVSEAFAEDDRVGFGSEGLTNAIGGSLVIDFRDQAFDPTFGFKLELAGLYHGPEIGDSPFRYGRFLADIALFIPVVVLDPDPVVLGLHGRIEVVDASLAAIPFYELPALGGSTTLRGYLEGRLRDRHSLLFQAELRFPLWRVLKGGIFVEAGRVYDKITDPLDPPFLSHFLWSAGAGVRFVLHPDILVRLDFGASVEEGLGFWLAFGHAF